MISWLELVIATLIALFPIVNPVGAIPTFLAITESDSLARRKQQLMKACIYTFFILVIFLVAGNLIMNFFGISIPGIRIAGGIMLSRISLNMLKAEPKYNESEEEKTESIHKSDISFTPLAMPILSGPGAIAVTLGLTASIYHWYDYFAVILGILIVTISCWMILRASTQITKVMGINGMNAMTRMMGFLILCVGIQFIINGILNIVTDQTLLQKLIDFHKSASG